MRSLFIFILLTGFFANISAQENETCFDCHNDPEMTMTKGKKEISLNVSPEKFAESMHADLECVDCHVGFDPDEDPHLDKIVPVNCAECHDDAVETFQHSKHAGEIKCTSCHTNVHQPETRVALTSKCQNCHKEEMAETKSSIHAKNKKGPDCAGCHDPHNGLEAVSANCLSCHGEKEFVKENIAGENVESVMKYSQSIHGENIECSDCHGSHEILETSDVNSPVNRANIVSTCSDCHDDIKDEFLKSEHGKNILNLVDAPTCTGCHGEHDIYQITDSDSKMSRQHEIEVCLSCHLDNPDVRERMTHASKFISGYETSVHGRKNKEGDMQAAICSDCHGAHSPMKASDPNSSVNKFNISKTCAKCHEEIAEQYENSIHGTELQKGVEDAPTCTDCHGEHNILEPTLAESPISPQNVSRQVCGPCHSSVKLTEKYGLSSNRFEAYNDSYHGLAVRSGDVEAANCASCHGVHNILPSSNPESKIHVNNLAKTCGSCHPGANKNFTKGSVHVTFEESNDELLYWISTIYILMIVGTIGGMGFHNLLDFIRKMVNKYKEHFSPSESVDIEKRRTHYTRMTVEDRIQHISLASSFLVLVLTGFMLKYPDAWWVTSLRQLGAETVFELRGIIHRVAAVVMVLASIYHMYYVIFTARGRQFVKDIWFNLQDLKDMVIVLRYNLGLSNKRAKFDRFNYIEKSEYWALIWGTIVMTVTGVALWFENQTMGWFSKLFIDVAETIHYYEAWLAFLAIVVWHFYYVIFNPDVYPMNFTWLTGKVTEEEMEHEHPVELKRIKENKIKETDENQSA
ncbi:MAG: cytochrome c3 family protein [Calditrichaeota bacterium]|nr:cytochrome c3 family protein [Calditrichota bacterium]